MQENTNRIIAYNSVILYVRMVLTALCGLFITRIALKALGVIDFGLFSVLGSIITFVSIFNTIMLSTSNRFIAVSIGKGDLNETNEQFNINLIIHIGIAIITLLLAFPIGDWYIHRFVNFDGDLELAVKVFNYSVIGSVISFVGVPYNGLLMAKEKFIVFCSTDVIAHVLKLVGTYSLLFFFSNKLIVFALLQAFCTGIPTLVYWLYCDKHYKEIVRFMLVKNKNKYQEVLSFSGWIAYGAVATVGKNQGAALVINAFFNTVLNTALGIANSVYALITMFAENVTKPIAPQITKSYASGDLDRSIKLLVSSTKYSFLIMFLVSSPLLIDCNWVLHLWLGEVPEYAEQFTKLMIIDALVLSLCSGVSNFIFASGKIWLYQVVINSLRLLSVVVAFFVLKSGFDAEYLLYTYIVFSFIVFFATMWVLKKTLSFNNSILFRGSYLPSLLVVSLFCPVLFFDLPLGGLLKIILALLYLIALIWFVALDKNEKKSLASFVLKRNK